MDMDLIHSAWKRALAIGFERPRLPPETEPATVINAAMHAVEEHLLASPHMRAYLEAVPKGLGTDCPDSPIDELVKYVANQKGLVDKSDPALNLRFLRTFVIPVLRLEQDAVTACLAENRDISAGEMRLFLECRTLSEAVDGLWAAWFARLVVPHHSLPKAAKEHAEQAMRGTLAQYDYTAYDYDPVKGFVGRAPWVIAFPREIAAIRSALAELKTTRLPGLADYFSALDAAYACEDIDRLEELWTLVDVAWIRIPRTVRFVPVHNIESGYEHPFGVSPEFRLEARTDIDQGLIAARRIATAAHAATFGLKQEVIDALAPKLEHIDIGVFVTTLRAGVSCNFRYAGQAAPNRPDVTAEGARIFIDKSASVRSVGTYTAALTKHCTPATSSALSPLISGQSQTESTTTHEYAHMVGRTAQSDAALGRLPMSLCEEAKATLLGILADEHLEPTASHRRALVANAVGRVVRFMNTALLESTTFAPYVRENLAAATMLFESGVMSLTPDGLVVHLELADGPAWFDALRVFNHGVLHAYQAHDAAALQHMAARYCSREHPQVAALIAWVNRK